MQTYKMAKDKVKTERKKIIFLRLDNALSSLTTTLFDYINIKRMFIAYVWARNIKGWCDTNLGAYVEHLSLTQKRVVFRNL